MAERSKSQPATLQSMSVAELKRFRSDLAAQIAKLGQAASSINDAAIRSSLIRNGPQRDATADELRKVDDTDDILATVTVLLDTLQAQLSATDEELVLRRREKFERVQEGLASKISSLETSIAKDAKRHLKNAEAARETFLEGVQQHNRFHESKVEAIRQAVEKSKEDRYRQHLEQVHEEEEKERRRATAMQAKQEQRRAAFAKRAEMLQQTLDRFDQQRMAALQSPSRASGALVKDILSASAGARQVMFRQQAKSTSPDISTAANQSRIHGTGGSSLNLHSSLQQRQAPQETESKWAGLTRLPPRGISLAKQLDKEMNDHLAKATVNKLTIAEQARDERARREARQDKLHDALYKQHEHSWAEKEKRRQDAYARIDALRQVQREIPAPSPSPSACGDVADGSVRRQPPAKPLVDHAAIRARLLIASACEFVVAHQSLDRGPAIPRGFESSGRR